ncbi:unnamed protein product [Colias eurytheme]|nr:unnamed protein product [Colias eurytheme]
MSELRLLVSLLLVQCFILCADCIKHHRRSMGPHSNLPVSKSGWRPVVGSEGLLYGSFGTAPLHAPYKSPVPIHDYYSSTGRPLAQRDVAKLTSIAQSYRPTTLRTVPVSQGNPAGNQPINSYLNPYALPNNGFTQYKFVQNYPGDNVFIRNPQNQFLSRPVYQQKFPTKQKQQQQQQYHNNILQSLTSIQPIHFGYYSTPTPVNILGNPIQIYARPDSKRPQASGTEIYKQELYKLPNNAQQVNQQTNQQGNQQANQQTNQQVKTAQQQAVAATNLQSANPYFQYSLQDLAQIQQLPHSLLSSFGSFGIQSVKNRDPGYSTTKGTYQQPQPTKQTLFQSLNFQNGVKSTPAVFATSTPNTQAVQNQFSFGTTFNDLANVPTPRTKPAHPTKIDPNAGKKTGGFKPSPQDPFIKTNQQGEQNRITTYNPQISHVTSAPNQYYDYNFDLQKTQQQNYNQDSLNYNSNNQQLYDNLGLNQQVSQQYINAPSASNADSTLNGVSYQPTYEVTDKEADDVTHASTGGWLQDPYETNEKLTEDSTLKSDYSNALFATPTTTLNESPDEYAIVTEADIGFENGFNYNSQIESQSRRPLGDDFEPIGQQKLKDYYYKVSTPSSRRTKKPAKIVQEVTTQATVSSEVPVEALPTLPPDQHFKRPSAPETTEKERTRKRNKIRRRRPIGHRHRDESNTPKSTTTTSDVPQTTEETHTVRPRIRPLKSRTESPLTTLSVTTELTTSALPTISPTSPTVTAMKKKVNHQRFLTTNAARQETTTQIISEESKESPIMKIATRPQNTRNSYDYRNSEVPDYSHKQDEKDTPTSDISVSLTDTYKNSADILKDFSFHRDVRPVEIKEVTTEAIRESAEIETTTTPKIETSKNIGKIQRPKLKNKYDRPKFSVKDYRNRLSSTTSSTEKPTENTPRPRPHRKNPYSEINSDVETTTERKRFTPKEPRHKLNRTDNNEQEIHSRTHIRQRQTTPDTTESTTQKISARIRNGQRRPKPTEETIETSSTTVGKRPLRKKIKDSETGESVQDVSISETAYNSDHKNDFTSERTRSESAIMKIADKKHQDHIERLFEHSKRVSDLTLAASKDYNTPGMFKTVSSNSRRIPNYFTIATDDPILPIEAFFPQLNQKKESQLS